MVWLLDLKPTKLSENSSKAEVKAWLDRTKQELGLEFDVQKLACVGKSFVALSEAQFEKYGGGLPGVKIYTALQKGYAF